jgi:acetolactate synthase-1/2/3 large subunit
MNPGTSEMHFVAALDRVPGLRGILCLFEGVCSGAADGYARALGRPASTLLHLGPGLGNALANFHNARKARSAVVNIVGEHATPHLRVDAPLSADIETFARAVSSYVRTTTGAGDVGPAVSETISHAWGPPGSVATLIVPADHSWTEGGIPGPKAYLTPQTLVADDVIRKVAELLPLPGTRIMLGGTTVNPRALDAAHRISARTGAQIAMARNCGRISTGRGRFQPPQVPYFPEGALPFLANVQNLVLVEAETPVSFFAYPGIPSYMVPEGSVSTVLARRQDDGTAALEALADFCGAGRAQLEDQAPALVREEDAPLTLEALGQTLAALLPEGALVSDECVSSAVPILTALRSAAPHESMPVTGGSIGQGLPVAVGAAVACPDRKVLAIDADGSAMYTLQSLWTMARERLDVTVVILANRRYKILDIEMQRTGANGFGPIAEGMIDISRPELDFVKLAEGMGVEAGRARTAREFARLAREALGRGGPFLIEAVI